MPTPPDTTAPTVSLTAPANGATVSGSVALAATASDNVGVTKVEFRADGVLVGTDTSAPYTGTWNASAASPGSHTIQARAYDAANNTTNASVSVTVPDPARHHRPDHHGHQQRHDVGVGLVSRRAEHHPVGQRAGHDPVPVGRRNRRSVDHLRCPVQRA